MKQIPFSIKTCLALGATLMMVFGSAWIAPVGAQGPPAPTCNGLTATIWVNDLGIIVGGPNDGATYVGTLQGDSTDDVMVAPPLTIYSATGNDLNGFGGNDTMCGSDNDDDINGFGGNDYIDGGAGNDTLTGAGGDDTLLGGAGNDTIFGGAGTDSADGGPDIDGCEADNIIVGNGSPQANCENDPTAISLVDLSINGETTAFLLPTVLLILLSLASLFVYRQHKRQM